MKCLSPLWVAFGGLITIFLLPASTLSASTLSAQSLDKATLLFSMQGSNTIGEKLAPALVEQYLKEIGAQETMVVNTQEVEKSVIGLFADDSIKAVEIKAHGSSTGFTALEANDTDIAMSSRRIKDKERDLLLAQHGDLKSFDNEYTLAVDGLAVIVHPSINIKQLDTHQLAQIFSGKIHNWKQLGGEDQRISVFARDEKSGTFDTFKSLVLKRHQVKLIDNAKRYESSGELSTMVSITPGAIGFVALPYVNQAKTVAVSEQGVALSFLPNVFTVSTEDYVLGRRLYLYFPSNNNNQYARQFVEFVLQQKAQQIVEKTGLVSLNVNDATIRFNRNYPARYLNMISDSKRLSITFHFDENTHLLDNKAQRDISRLVQYIQNHNLKDLFLFGFSSDSGDAAYDKELSKKFSRLIEAKLVERGITPFYVSGFGHKGAIASNSTVNGRNKNRRVEVWVGK